MEPYKEFPPIPDDECDRLLAWFQRWRVAGSPSNTDCWLWTGKVNNNGYGRTSIPGYESWGDYLAHRVMWTLAHPFEYIDCLQLDHDQNGCDRLCVNPYHLVPMFPWEHSCQTLGQPQTILGFLFGL